MKRLVFAIFIFTISSLSCSEKPLSEKIGKMDEGLYNVKILQKNYEKKSFELYAKKIEFQKDTSIAYNIKVVFFNPSQDTSSVLFAKRGWYVEKTGNVGAFGDVRVFSKKGDSLYTDTLYYLDSTRKIISPSRVLILRKGERITGENLESDAEFKHIIIGGKVIGEKRGSE